MLSFLSGVIAPMFTPCNSDGSIDAPGVEGMIKWWKTRRGLNTIFVRSGMGKMFTFSVEETLLLARASLAANNGHYGILVGSGGEWRNRRAGGRPDRQTYLSQAIYLTQQVKELGADGAVHVLPFAIETAPGETKEELIYWYVSAVHDSSNIPIVLYQPGETPQDYRMTPSLLKRLLSLPRLAGIKVSSSDYKVFHPLAEAAHGADFALICGDESYYKNALIQGAAGVIGEGSNVYPEILADMKTAFDAGDIEAASRCQGDVMRGLSLLSGLNSGIAWRQLMIRRGARFQPYDREEQSPYSDEIINRVEAGWLELLKPYERS